MAEGVEKSMITGWRLEKKPTDNASENSSVSDFQTLHKKSHLEKFDRSRVKLSAPVPRIRPTDDGKSLAAPPRTPYTRNRLARPLKWSRQYDRPLIRKLQNDTPLIRTFEKDTPLTRKVQNDTPLIRTFETGKPLTRKVQSDTPLIQTFEKDKPLLQLYPRPKGLAIDARKGQEGAIKRSVCVGEKHQRPPLIRKYRARRTSSGPTSKDLPLIPKHRIGAIPSSPELKHLPLIRKNVFMRVLRFGTPQLRSSMTQEEKIEEEPQFKPTESANAPQSNMRVRVFSLARETTQTATAPRSSIQTRVFELSRHPTKRLYISEEQKQTLPGTEQDAPPHLVLRLCKSGRVARRVLVEQGSGCVARRVHAEQRRVLMKQRRSRPRRPRTYGSDKVREFIRKGYRVHHAIMPAKDSPKDAKAIRQLASREPEELHVLLDEVLTSFQKLAPRSLAKDLE
ncbi:MAG: hypothetical protein Q9191_002206 [Dirinaria sp. TL-2023a]